MILSRTCQYALQSLIYIATRPQGEIVLARSVAGHLRVPPDYLSKIMQNLGKAGLVESYRGRQGGFRLHPGAADADLMRVVILIEGPRFIEDCVLGLKVCSNETRCPMHVKWRPIKDRIARFLRTQTLGVLAEAVKGGKYRLADVPEALIVRPRIGSGGRQTKLTAPSARQP